MDVILISFFPTLGISIFWESTRATSSLLTVARVCSRYRITNVPSGWLGTFSRKISVRNSPQIETMHLVGKSDSGVPAATCEIEHSKEREYALGVVFANLKGYFGCIMAEQQQSTHRPRTRKQLSPGNPALDRRPRAMVRGG